MPLGMNEPRPLVQTSGGFTSDNGVLVFLLRPLTAQELAGPSGSGGHDPFRYDVVGTPLLVGQQVQPDCVFRFPCCLPLTLRPMQHAPHSSYRCSATLTAAYGSETTAPLF